KTRESRRASDPFKTGRSEHGDGCPALWIAGQGALLQRAQRLSRMDRPGDGPGESAAGGPRLRGPGGEYGQGILAARKESDEAGTGRRRTRRGGGPQGR